MGAATIAILLCGTFLPIFTETNSSDYPGEEDETREAWSLALIIAKLSSGSNEVSGGDDEWSILIAISFIGLAVVVLLLITVVVPMTTLQVDAVGPMSRRRSMIFKTLVILGIVGSLVPLLLSGMALGSEEVDAGWGAVVLCLAMGLTAALVFGPIGAVKTDRNGIR